MNEEEIIKLIFTLVDDFDPNGDESHDKVANENLAKLIGITKSLHCRINDILTNTSKSRLDSLKNAHKMCDEYFDWLGVPD